jgi:hypothetical protein
MSVQNQMTVTLSRSVNGAEVKYVPVVLMGRRAIKESSSQNELPSANANDWVESPKLSIKNKEFRRKVIDTLVSNDYHNMFSDIDDCTYYFLTMRRMVPGCSY